MPSRGVKEQEITKIIQDHLVVEPDLEVAEQKLLATTGLGKFYRALKTEPEKEDFRRHLRRYMQIYLPDCPFEVAATNRYTIFQEEACISARRFIKSNETIKYLAGIQVVITAEEEAELSERKKDFSIIVSSRKKEVNLFMGPARFSNHDCDANARLVTTGQAGIEIIATKSIGVGEEITVTYGDSYFGEDNCECLCKTCEDNLVNGWAPADGVVPVKQSVEDGSHTPIQGYSLRRREEHSFNRGNSETPSLTPVARPKVSKASLRKLLRGAAEAISSIDGRASSVAVKSSSMELDSESLHRGQKRERDSSILATPPVTPAKRQKTAMSEVDETTSETDDTSTTAAVGPSQISKPNATTENSPAPSDGEENKEAVQSEGQMPTPEPSQQLAESDVCESELGESIVVASTVTTTVVTETTTMLKVEESTSMDELTLPTPEYSLDSEEDEKTGDKMDEKPDATADDTTTAETTTENAQPAVHTPRRGRPRKYPVSDSEMQTKPKAAPRAKVEEDVTEDDDEADESSGPSRQRVPGDYTLTPLLLAEPETAWVICSVCSKAFVQRDAYFTRMCCPRCERHSKLYGYMWPKTELEGKWDKEERILDHRLVHRFLHAGDEAKIRGRKQVAWQDEDAATTDDDRTGKKESLGSGIWRKLRYTIEKEKAEQAKAKPKPKPKSTATKTATVTKVVKATVSKTTKTTKTTKTATVTKIVKSAKAAVASRRQVKKPAVAAKANKPATSTGRTARAVKTAKVFRGPRRSGRPRRTSSRLSSD